MVSVCGKKIELTAKEFELLALLISNPNRVVGSGPARGGEKIRKHQYLCGLPDFLNHLSVKHWIL